MQTAGVLLSFINCYHISVTKERDDIDAYTSSASVYDTFMDNIPYEEWYAYLRELLTEYGMEDGLVLDFGCGTGSASELLSAMGYDVIGVDNPGEILQIAMEKRAESGRDTLYLLQDMREFELYGTVRAVISICDSMNYVTEYEGLVTVFHLVNNYLGPEGVFIFDVNIVYKYEQLLGDNTIVGSRDDCSSIWNNDYDKDTMINEYDLALFIREEDDLYRKYEETRFQKAYNLETVKQAIVEADMEFVAVCDAFTKEPPRTDSERIYVIARE